MDLHAFPKIFALGQPYIKDIFDGEVEVTEKIDGSQFVFGKVKGRLQMRSKGQELFVANPEKMFADGITYVDSIQHLLPEGFVFYCEYLQKPKHNVLAYSRTPLNHLVLFGVYDFLHAEFISDYQRLMAYAVDLNIEVAPRFQFHAGRMDSPTLDQLLDQESFLGGAKIEGIVVKNYNKTMLIGGQALPIMSGKYVSEAFKEVHRGVKGDYNPKGRWEVFKESYRTEARWQKGIQHLIEKSEITFDPKDIGKIIKEIHYDIVAEEKENITEFLWKEYGQELVRTSTRGFPEFYKRYLLERSTENGNA